MPNSKKQNQDRKTRKRLARAEAMREAAERASAGLGTDSRMRLRAKSGANPQAPASANRRKLPGTFEGGHQR